MKSMKYSLFLDDLRMPRDAVIIGKGENGLKKLTPLSTASDIPDANWIVVRTYNAFVKVIEKYGIPNVVSFDHDLHDEHIKHYFDHTRQTRLIDYSKFKHKTGKDCAEFLVKKCLETPNAKIPKIFIHSANATGRKNIKRALNRLFKNQEE